MPDKKLTHAQTRNLVEAVARQIAYEHGATLSPAALRRLVAPSKVFFAEHGSVRVNRERLRRELTSLVLHAVRAANPPRRVSGDRIILAARGDYLSNPRPKKKDVRAKDIGSAMKQATCHFLWFC
jgi:RNase P/RNase MRP subunit POP5